ncbi:dimethylarginine dimethylaminohydrolase family protein [Clostridium tyrobutyricum]|uniref:dimethylarginine dimethylaminohydrolase family protein n=1 Tax=Clostridium tyrobutyricum TaxID=1519 RepID=UPI0018AB519A|nr:arginine deiminase family protein [Clostridium tyrobutyricum]
MKKTYVKNSTGVLKKVLLCSPKYFEFEPINVITEDWLDKGQKSNKESCLREHNELVQAYKENGVEVESIDPDINLPYEVFARDFGGCISEGFIMGKFREPVRQGETEKYEAKMKELGIPCVARCTSGAYEGGDFWFLDEYTLVQGVIARTDLDGAENIKRQVSELGYNMIMVPALRQNLHLDMCFNIAAEKVAVVCKEALPYNFLKMLEKRKFTLIDVPQEGVFRHYCNLQALGDDRVITFNNNKIVNEKLDALGIKTIKLDLVEILKGGGGPHCMTFPLERI